jgi:hypothetical protein
MDDCAYIKVDGGIVREIPIYDGGDRHAMDTMQMRGAGSDASGHSLDSASSLVA